MAIQTNNDRSIKTQTNILQATTRLTRKNGWKNTTIRDICTEAGISIGAFYHHFSSKQELMNHSFILFDATLNENLPNESIHPLEAVKNVLLTQTAFIVQEANTLIAEYYKNILADENKSATNPDRMYYQRVLLYVQQAKAQELFRTGYAPEYIAEFLIKFVRGCIIDWCLHNYAYDVVLQTDAELDLVIGALCVKEDS